MAKKLRPGAQVNPAVRLSNLRPRLAQIFADAQIDHATVQAELDQLTDGLKPASFLSLLVGAFVAAPDQQRERLAGPVGAWLGERGLLEALRSLEARQTLEGAERAMARSWLEAGDIAPAPESALTLADLFIDAYEVGDPAQASVTLFWYEDARRRRARFASFLIDFQPPWEGALKDLAYDTFRDSGQAHAKFFTVWEESPLQHYPVDVVAATRRVWTALRQSQAQGIRLPADFIAVMPEVVPFLLALPTDPAAPALSPVEILDLARRGRIPEDIRRDERRFGFQKRMSDGSIMRVVNLFDDDL